MKEKEKFIKNRKEMIEFVERTIEQKWIKERAMYIVDCILVNWIIPYMDEKKEEMLKKIKDNELIKEGEDTIKELNRVFGI